MLEALQSIRGWYTAYFSDGFYLVLALFSYIYLFVHCSELRKRFLIPIGVIMFIVFNPLLYKYVYSKIIYWRLFWMFPTGILIALAAVKMVKNSQGRWVKGLVLVAFCGLIVIKGTNIIIDRGFGKIQNPEKVPGTVKEICDMMLELEETPRCIMPEALFCDVRQYSGEIEMMYGRNVVGYISLATEADSRTWWEMENDTPNYEIVLRNASEKRYQFVITYRDHPIGQDVLDLYGYEDIGYEGDYYIYYLE